MTITLSFNPELAAIDGALADSDRTAALRAALDAWRACRAKPLATLIDVLSADIARGRPAIEDLATYATAWIEVEAAGDPGDLARLAGGVVDGPKKTTGERMLKLLERGPDPRTGRALVRFLVAQQFPAGT